LTLHSWFRTSVNTSTWNRFSFFYFHLTIRCYCCYSSFLYLQYFSLNILRRNLNCLFFFFFVCIVKNKNKCFSFFCTLWICSNDYTNSSFSSFFLFFIKKVYLRISLCAFFSCCLTRVYSTLFVRFFLCITRLVLHLCIRKVNSLFHLMYTYIFFFINATMFSIQIKCIGIKKQKKNVMINLSYSFEFLKYMSVVFVE